ncbi:POK9 protein, partial [Falcunculus frontatus]|nr:POK9 protein [Falcunculus frontatus]
QCLQKKSAAGKRETEREKQQPRSDTSSCSLQRPAIISPDTLRPATAGSLGLDLAAAVDMDITNTEPVKIPTNVIGPIKINGQAVGALLLGRSSTTMKGLFIQPGLIDADFEGRIQIMAYAHLPPLRIIKGQRLAQLVPLPSLIAQTTPLQPCARGDQGFGSTGDNLACLTLDMSKRPQLTVQIEYKNVQITLKGLMDTGADTTVVSSRCWPVEWPTIFADATISGVGGMTIARKSPLLTIYVENRRIKTAVAILELPDTVAMLVGRDILGQLGFRI